MSSVCVTCGEALAAGAKKCKTCNSYQGNACIVCSGSLPDGAGRCNACGTFQRGTPCSSCGTMLLAHAKRCFACQTFGDWRRFLPKSEVVLALIATVLSLLAAIVPPILGWNNDRSITDVHVLGTERITERDGDRYVVVPTIHLKVTNGGKRPSVVRSGSVEFSAALKKALGTPKVSIQEMKETYLRPGDTTDLHLRADGFDLARNLDLGMLAKHTVTVTLEIEENTRGKYKATSRHDTVRADRIGGWLNATD